MNYLLIGTPMNFIKIKIFSICLHGYIHTRTQKYVFRWAINRGSLLHVIHHQIDPSLLTDLTFHIYFCLSFYTYRPPTTHPNPTTNPTRNQRFPPHSTNRNCANSTPAHFRKTRQWNLTLKKQRVWRNCWGRCWMPGRYYRLWRLRLISGIRTRIWMSFW